VAVHVQVLLLVVAVFAILLLTQHAQADRAASTARVKPLPRTLLQTPRRSFELLVGFRQAIVTGQGPIANINSNTGTTVTPTGKH